MIPQSNIHSKYGDWRKNMIRFGKKYDVLSTSDLDVIETTAGSLSRCWLEIDMKQNKLLSILDLKYLPDDGITKAEQIVFRTFIELGIHVFIVFIERKELIDSTKFYVSVPGNSKVWILDGGKSYAEWLYQQRNNNFEYLFKLQSMDLDVLIKSIPNPTETGKGNTIMFEVSDARKKGGVKTMTQDELFAYEYKWMKQEEVYMYYLGLQAGGQLQHAARAKKELKKLNDIEREGGYRLTI